MKAVNVFGLPGGQNLIYPKPAAQLTRPEAVARVNHDRLDPTPEGVTANSTAKAKKKLPLTGVQPKHATEQRGGMSGIPPLHQGTYSEQSAGYKLAVRYVKDLEGMDKEAFGWVPGLAARALPWLGRAVGWGAKAAPAAAKTAPAAARAATKFKPVIPGGRQFAKAKFMDSTPGRTLRSVGNVAGNTFGGEFIGMGADTAYEFATGDESNGRFANIGGAIGLGRGLSLGTGIGRRALKRGLGQRNYKALQGFGSGERMQGLKRKANLAAMLGMAGTAQEAYTGGWNHMRPIQTARAMAAGSEQSLAQRMGLRDQHELNAVLARIRNTVDNYRNRQVA